MDLNAITTIARPRSRDDIESFAAGDAWLAGGTWLLSEPQPRLRRLIDLSTLDWAPLRISDAGLFVAATCTVVDRGPADRPVLPRLSRLVQDLEHGDRRRQLVHGVARRADDLAFGRARRGLRDLDA